jgi:hypothetical protein
MWKALYYRKQAQSFLMMSRLTRDEDKAARFALIASEYFEKADRATAEATMHPQ